MRVPAQLPFVGRERELEQIGARARDVTSSGRRVLLVRGPAGIGKTRLVHEALEHVGTTVVWVRCWDGGPAMWAWHQVLEQLGRPPVPMGTADRLDVFSSMLGELRSEGPMVVVLDDLHLSDPTTMLFTRFLARSVPSPDVLVVATARTSAEFDDERGAELAELAREADELLLDHLEHREVVTMLAAAGVDLGDASLVDALVTLTRGLPLAVERTATMVGHDDGRAVDLTATVERAGRSVAGRERRLLATAAVYGPAMTVAELRRVGGVAEAEALEAVAEGRRVGLILEDVPSVLNFTHDLVREAVVTWLSPVDRAEVHRRAVAELRGGPAPRLALAAEHAAALARIDTSWAGDAVELYFEAAEQHRRRGAVESALHCCDAADRLAQQSGSVLPIRHRLAHADTALRAGRLARARQLFRALAEASEREAEPLVFADAAIGLGGIWLAEHRDEYEATAVRILQRRALEQVEHLDAARALALRVRIAGEAAYHSRDLTELDALMAEVIETGSARTVAEALSITIHAKLGPAFAAERLVLAEQMTAAAAEAGDPLTSLLAQCWTTVALELAGDDRAARARRALELRCDTIRCAGVQFISDAMTVGDLVSAGRFDEAEAAAETCFHFGQSVGDADAWNYYAGHLAAIRYYQGRHGELAQFATAASVAPTTLASERALTTTAAAFALRAGDRAPAERIVAAHRARPEPSDYQPSTWLVAMHGLVRIAVDLDDAELGRSLVAQLTPFRGLNSSLSMAIADLGPVDWSIGLASIAAGELQQAETELAAAIALARRRSHHPAAVVATADRAEVLHRLGRTAEAVAELDAAIAEAEDRSMTGWVVSWRELRAGWSSEPGPASGVQFSRIDPGHWSCRFAGAVALVPDSVGIRHLAALCAAPGVEFPAVRLAFLAEPDEVRHGVTDGTALTDLRRRADALRQQIDEGVGGRRAAEDELDAINAHLLAVLGRDGSRTFSDANERARTSVRKAIARAIAKIAVVDPVIAAHLTDSVVTGHRCAYRPVPPGLSSPL